MKKIQFGSMTQFSTPLSSQQLEDILGGLPTKNQGSQDWMDSTSELASGGSTTDSYEDGYQSGTYTAGESSPPPVG